MCARRDTKRLCAFLFHPIHADALQHKDGLRGDTEAPDGRDRYSDLVPSYFEGARSPVCLFGPPCLSESSALLERSRKLELDHLADTSGAQFSQRRPGSL